MAARKAVIIGSIATLVVATAVVATLHFVYKKPHEDNNNFANQSQKAIRDLCQNTYYKETCIESLTKATNSSDLKTLIQAGFRVAAKELAYVNQKLRPLEIATEDPVAASAYRTCQKFLDDSMNDLQRTFDRADVLDFDNFWVVMDDMRTWLTGALTYQETCLDRFEDVKGDAVEKIKKFLRPAREITINSLAMANLFSTVLEQTGVGLGLKLGTGEFTWPNGATKTHKLLRANPEAIKPNVIVAKDGSGNYTSITEALHEVPVQGNDTFVIHVKEGVYQEYVNITSSMTSVMLIGDGPTKTRITGNKSKGSLVNLDTYWTATVVVEGDNFIGRDIGFENTAGGELHQAVALLVAADKAIFYNCHIDGHQDTLCAHVHRQFYRDCTISGTVDFVFGNARAVLQNCTLIVRKPLENQDCMVTAQGRQFVNETSALILQSCRIVPSPDYPVDDKSIKTYLGRPWKPASRTIIMDSEIDGFIDPAGWADWSAESDHLSSCWYAEVDNHGPGSDMGGRVKESGIKEITSNEAKDFTPAKLLADYWIGGLGIPYSSGRMSQ
ncbi:hypothetical protein ACS0TY_027831 [Phlomoides rotata]